MTVRSTFGHRFSFAVERLRASGKIKSDKDLSPLLKVAPGRISSWQKALEAPGIAQVLRIAEETGFDPGWIAFGGSSQAPEPSGFSKWLAGQRALFGKRFDEDEAASA